MAIANSADFYVKNGLVLSGNLIYASGTGSNVGIGTGTPDATLKVAGTANVSGNAVLGGNVSLIGNATFSAYAFIGTGASNVAINSSAISLAAGNILINTSTITIGAGSTNNSINATNYSGIANNSTNFAGNPITFYANVTNPVFSANISVGTPTVNTSINSTALVMGNVALNTISMGVGANMFMNTSVFSIGGISTCKYRPKFLDHHDRSVGY